MVLEKAYGGVGGDVRKIDIFSGLPHWLVTEDQPPPGFTSVDMSDPPEHFMLFIMLYKGGLTDDRRSPRGIQNPGQMDSSYRFRERDPITLNGHTGPLKSNAL